MIPATHLDLYQLTSLIPHWDAQRAQRAVWMSFFSRRLPRGHDGQNARDFIVWCGLRRCLHLLSQLRFDDERLETLSAHPVLGPALRARPLLVERLRAWRFHGEVWAIDDRSARGRRADDFQQHALVRSWLRGARDAGRQQLSPVISDVLNKYLEGDACGFGQISPRVHPLDVGIPLIRGQIRRHCL